MFSDKVIAGVVKAARKERLDPAAAMAVVEVESAGRPFEDDGRMPRLLFERHVFYRELKKKSLEVLDKGRIAGLAIPKWDRAKQYNDQRTSAGRIAVYEAARDIDEEAANRSCSWGIGQTMGFNAERLGFASATEMLTKMTNAGIFGQIDCMMREIRASKLVDALNARDFAKFARAYNGPGYKQNSYDTKMEAAFKKWSLKLDSMALEDVGMNPEEKLEEIPSSRVAEPPKSLIKSKVAAAGGTIATAGGGLIVDQALDAADKVRAVKETAADIGILDWFMQVSGHLMTKPYFWMALVIIALIIFIIWDRRKKLIEEHV